jgi:transcriptional regulator with XRE-family HTH domain
LVVLPITMQPDFPYSLKLWGELGAAARIAAEAGVRRAHDTLRPKRKQTFGTVRRPGHATPLWNVLATQLHERLRPYGSKTRLANYLGIPPQRLSDYLSGRSRLPDAEITLRLAFWLCETADVRDPSLALASPKPGRPRLTPE